MAGVASVPALIREDDPLEIGLIENLQREDLSPLEEAEALIRQAYRLQPNEASIVDSMGWVSYRLGRLEEAHRFLVRAWELDRNAEIAAHLGEVLWVMEREEEALAAWRAGAEVDPDNLILIETLQRLGVRL
jgi:tetratricopeptide (TPR) repeat protein